MDLEYIRYLMQYSDQKYPFEKAKSDPGLGESWNSVKQFLKENGATRKIDNSEANQILMNELNIKRTVRDIDDEYIPKAEKFLEDLERQKSGTPRPMSFNDFENTEGRLKKPKPKTDSDLENELAMLRQQVQAKEAELMARLKGNVNELKRIEPKEEILTPKPNPFEEYKQKTKAIIPTPPTLKDGIIERKLDETGYTDKIN